MDYKYIKIKTDGQFDKYYFMIRITSADRLS